MTATAEPGVLADLTEARERTLALVAEISDEDLERVHSPLMSPLVWDLGHIAAFEDLWICHRHGGRPLLRADLADVYDAFETPRARRGDLNFLGPEAARDYLDEVRARTHEVLGERGPGDGVITELILRHEHQHTETMLQTMQLAHLRGFRPLTHDRVDAIFTGLETVTVAAGPCEIGAPPGDFAYDNERPSHRVRLDAFEIGRTAVTNGAWRDWVDGGGYARREWWSADGWAWRTEQAATRPGSWSEDLSHEWRLGELTELDPGLPVVHVSFFEADAFARAHGARLPTEQEWEKAAGWDPVEGRRRERPWGEAEAVAGRHANLDQLTGGTVNAGALSAGVSPYGCLGMLGDTWEWTASTFNGYAGFEPFPYREYSSVFFGGAYRVLRGGSWATRPRVATTSFRNWDFPQRRQIFSGVRIARDR